jgi:hypothetical protein
VTVEESDIDASLARVRPRWDSQRAERVLAGVLARLGAGGRRRSSRVGVPFGWRSGLPRGAR